MDKFLWWRDGIIYQIYPRSFADSNNDGLGDLPGILGKLDYLADLGVDALWLSPFYPTPDHDFGYDISDYCNVDARFGTLEDFDRLVQAAHRRGMRIVIDMVMNHTSDQHPWFTESRASRESPKRDWYIWRGTQGAAGQPGRVPNNWQASFGGKAWTYDPASGEYYLHLFTRQQPDVNWRNPAVREAQLEAFRFWLNRGVDGFRLDVFNAYFKDAALRSNPPKWGLRAFDRQHHRHDMDQPEMMPLLGDLRHLLDEYPQTYSVGETYLATPQKTISYCGPQKLHAAFSFDFTSFESEIGTALHIFTWNPRWVMQKVMQREAVFNAAGVWPTTVMSNHDLPRAISRYGRRKDEDDRMAKIIMTLLLTLRGTPFIYQGEEIAMREVSLRRDELQDPLGKKYWPLYAGRDGCRSPMQWDDSPNTGFSPVRPWLKAHPNYTRRNVAAQQGQAASMLNFTRALITLRKAQPVLQSGQFIPVLANRHLLAYERRGSEGMIDGSILIVLNFSRKERHLRLPEGMQAKECLLASQEAGSRQDEQGLALAPLTACLWRVERRQAG